MFEPQQPVNFIHKLSKFPLRILLLKEVWLTFVHRSAAFCVPFYTPLWTENIKPWKFSTNFLFHFWMYLSHRFLLLTTFRYRILSSIKWMIQLSLIRTWQIWSYFFCIRFVTTQTLSAPVYLNRHWFENE